MPTGVAVGVAGPSRKLQATPMLAIVEALRQANSHLKLVSMDEFFMQATPVSRWPVVQVLLALYAPPFPLEKVISYVKLRRPVLVNNLYMQRYMMDRREIRAVLHHAGVPTPLALFVDRGCGDIVTQSHCGDVLKVWSRDRERCQVIVKPFVEKPVDPEDHNVYIYYKGGGVRKLFRKTKHESSHYVTHLIEVRSKGNFVYEQFYEPEQCADVKVYAVGDYFYAEARKAPHIDGIVERDQRGLERRVPVVLSIAELAICRKATAAFDQFVLGFDLLRAPGDNHFVIDVNGWSLVKNSDEYAVQCGNMLAKHIESVVGACVHSNTDTIELKKNAFLLSPSPPQLVQQPNPDLFDASPASLCFV